MKSTMLFILLAFCLNITYAQDYKFVDDKVKNYPDFTDINVLIIRVNNDFETNIDKARAYYTWISTNIDYNKNALISIGPAPTFKYRTANELKYIRKRRNLRAIERSFKEKKALCHEYALLYQFLCEASNIKCAVIRGVTKTSAYKINNISNVKDHAWNAVFIDNEWQLLDITWSAGRTDSRTLQWKKSFNDFFFFLPPEQFITSHFPEERKWQLLNTPISLRTFFAKPIFYASYFKNKIRINPNQSGTLKINENTDELQLEFYTAEANPKLYYSFSEDSFVRDMAVEEVAPNTFVATIKRRMLTLNASLTIYLENEAILNFKVVSN